MAEQIDLSKIVLVDKSIEDLKEMQQWVLRVNESIQGMSKAEVSIKGINGISSLNNSITQLTGANKVLADTINSLNNIQKKSGDTFKESANARSSSTKQQLDEIQKLEVAEQKAYEKRQAAGSAQAESTALEKERLRDRNLEVKNSAIVNAAAEGSLEQLRAQLALLTREYDKLSESERNSAKGQELQQKIKGQSDALFKLESETGRYSRNVGNYTQATKILEQSLEEVKQKMDNLKNSGEGNSDTFGKLQREEELLNRILQSNVNGFSSLTTEIRANERALAGMFQEGLAGSEAYQKLETEISNAKRELGEFREQQKLLSSQTPLLSAATLAAKGLAGAYAVGAGAAALFADGDEKVQKELEKLVAVMTILQGLQEVHELLEKKGTIAKIAGTIATQAQVVWQRILAATMVQSAAATVALRVALIALTGGLLLLVPLIAFAGQKVSEIKGRTEDTAEAMQRLSDVTAKAGEKFADAVTEVDKMKTQLGLARQGVIDKKKALEEYNTSIGKVIGQAKSLNEAEQLLIDKAPDYIQFTFLKAKAEAAAELAKESLKKSVEASTKSVEDFITFGDKAKETVSGFGNIFQLFNPTPSSKSIVKQTNDLLNVGKKAKEEAVKTEDGKYKAFAKLQDQFYTDAANFAKTHKLNFFEDSGDGKDGKDELDKSLKARFELLKIEKEREIKLLQETANDKSNPFASRYNALIDYVTLEEQLVIAQRDFDLKNQKLTENERKVIIAKAEDQILQIRKDAGQKVIELYQDNKSAQEKVLSDLKGFHQDEVDKELNQLTTSLSRRLTTIQQSADFETNIELGRYETGQINKEEYEKRKLAIENKARRDSLLAEIDYYEKLTKISNLAPDKEADALKKLSDLRKQLNALDVKNTEDANQKKEDSDKKYHDQLKEKLKELGDTLKETVFSLFESGIEQQKNQIQDQIDLVDKRSSKEIEVANQSILSEQDKAAKIAVINAKAQADKEALDRRSRQLDQQKARFEKAKSIAEIIENTSVAVVKTLADFPGPHGIALSIIIGAIGALNLTKVLATPIPKYYEGKNVHKLDSYEGHAVVDEGKDGKGNAPEMIIRKNGAVEMGGGKPRVVHLDRDDIVVPHDRVKEVFERRAAIERLPVSAISNSKNELPRFFVGKNMDRPLMKLVFSDIPAAKSTEKESRQEREVRYYTTKEERNNTTLLRKVRDYRHPLTPDLKQVAWKATLKAAEPFIHVSVTNQNEQLSKDIRMVGKNIVNAIKSQPKPKPMDRDYLWFKNWMKE